MRSIAHFGARRESSARQTACPRTSLFSAFLLLLSQGVASAASPRTPHDQAAFQRYTAYQLKTLSQGPTYSSIHERLEGTPREAGGLAAKQPLCGPRDVGATSFTGHWRLHRPTGQYFYEPLQCRLPRRSHSEALQCLSGKRISFAGDSVSRQHFSAFVLWIATGYMPQPYDDAIYSPTNAYKCSSWETYFAGLQKRVLQARGLLAHRQQGGLAAHQTHVSFTMKSPKKGRMALEVHGMGPSNASMYMDFVFAGNQPSFLNAGRRALDAIFGDRAKPTPDVVLLNMGAWFPEHGPASNKKLADTMEQVFHHGALLAAAAARGGDRGGHRGGGGGGGSGGGAAAVAVAVGGAESTNGSSVGAAGGGSGAAAAIDSGGGGGGGDVGGGKNVTLLWRTSMIQHWKVRNALLSEAARAARWGILDGYSLARAMHDQRLWLQMRRTDFSLDENHFLPVVYEQLIDMLLTRICP